MIRWTLLVLGALLGLAVLFFASRERARLVTGASLDVDAGLSLAFTEPAAYFARRGDSP